MTYRNQKIDDCDRCEKEFEGLENEPNSISADEQTFAFKSVRALDVYYDNQVVLPKEFKFMKNGATRVTPDTTSILIYDHLLPFNNAKHNDVDCVPAKNLPLFYKKKGGDQ